jgi:molecular chaperone GrpE
MTKKSMETESSKQLETKLTEITADLQRVQADFINYRRRSDEERGTILNLAKQDVILQILPLIDNLERGLGHLPKELQDNPWAKGITQAVDQAATVLKGLGITRIEALGQSFDPNLHEAIAADGEGDMVIEELQAGYRMGDRVLRHSLVKVGKKQ